ncbi:unnamed protein product [Linum trigynum]|uniref:Uncharacterized protein n=1 Tax=Linum trigynum TaxID=586398 RepID=A0AAV2GAG0_9ROSI
MVVSPPFPDSTASKNQRCCGVGISSVSRLCGDLKAALLRWYLLRLATQRQRRLMRKSEHNAATGGYYD